MEVVYKFTKLRYNTVFKPTTEKKISFSIYKYFKWKITSCWLLETFFFNICIYYFNLNDYFQGFLCSTTCIFNWINDPSSFNIWNGQYKCKFKNCPVKIKTTAKQHSSTEIRLLISQQGIPNHNYKIEIKKQIRGEERERLSLRVQAEGISNVRNNMICENQIAPSR